MALRGVFKFTPTLKRVFSPDYFAIELRLIRNVNTGQSGRQAMMRDVHNAGTKGPGLSGYALLVIPAAAFGLGTWQVRRRKWKLNLIEELQLRTTAPPVPFPDNLENLKELEYRKVTLRGRFDHSKELYVMPRSRVDGASESKRVEYTETGAYVITAFELESHPHSNLRIMVNRGWVPRNKVNPETRKDGQVEGVIEFVGVVRSSEKRPQFSGRNNPAKNQWLFKDLDAMSQVLDTSAVMIDADSKSTVAGGPIGGQTRVTLRNEHVSYIFTWYTLSAVTFYMWLKMVRK